MDCLLKKKGVLKYPLVRVNSTIISLTKLIIRDVNKGK